jgi:hypothetical protein
MYLKSMVPNIPEHMNIKHVFRYERPHLIQEFMQFRPVNFFLFLRHDSLIAVVIRALYWQVCHIQVLYHTVMNQDINNMNEYGLHS